MWKTEGGNKKINSIKTFVFRFSFSLILLNCRERFRRSGSIAKWIIKNEFLMNANPLIHSTPAPFSLFLNSQTKRIQDRK